MRIVFDDIACCSSSLCCYDSCLVVLCRKQLLGVRVMTASMSDEVNMQYMDGRDLIAKVHVFI